MRNVICILVASLVIICSPAFVGTVPVGTTSEAQPAAAVQVSAAAPPLATSIEPDTQAADEEEAQGGEGEESQKEQEEEKILKIEPSAHGWTLYAISVDAHELLTTFAAEAHLPLIVDDTVKRSLTIIGPLFCFCSDKQGSE